MGVYHTGVTKILDERGRGMVARGMNDKAISKELGCNPSTVQVWRARNNIQRVPQSPYLEKLNTVGLQMYNDGFSDRSIAKRIGCTAKNVCRWRKSRDLPTQCKSGSENWYILRPPPTYYQTLELVESGLSTREAAKVLGIPIRRFQQRLYRAKKFIKRVEDMP